MKAQADSEANAEVIGIVSASADANNFVFTRPGHPVTTLTGLTAGALYYLSPTSAGTTTVTRPTTAGQIVKPIFIAVSTTAATILIQSSIPATIIAGDIQFGSDAQGDIPYRGASAYARLGFGTSGQYLKTQGTGANPAWSTASTDLRQQLIGAWGYCTSGGSLTDGNNVDSCSKSATGTYTWTWTTDFANGNYAAVCNADDDAANGRVCHTKSHAAGTMSAQLNDYAANEQDVGHSVAAIGD